MITLDAFAEVLKPLIGGAKIEPFPQIIPHGKRHAYVFETSIGRIFVKTKEKNELEILLAEFKGLQSLREASQIAIPNIFGCGEFENKSFLAMEYLELVSHTATSQAELGALLALMHQERVPFSFGFETSTWLGETRQDNTWTDDWVEFFKTRRLKYQLSLLEKNYGDVEIIRQGFDLCERLSMYFSDLQIKPSLLHGDLWHGNTGCNLQGKPVIFDPASYYGHSEMDLSMIALFGGFLPEFFEAYHDHLPKQPGHVERLALYELYHSLNHYNLFGPSYREQCLRLLQKI